MDSPELKIGVLDTSIASANAGDSIIMQAALRELDACLPVAEVPLRHARETLRNELHLQRQVAFNVACGTNRLHSHMAIVKQWHVGLLAAGWMKPVVLLGVGWRSRHRGKRRSTPAGSCERFCPATPSIPCGIPIPGGGWRKIGVGNVAVTGCPTMWPLTPELCGDIPAEQGEAVVATLTDYSRDPNRDGQLIDLLTRAYRQVYFWCQGAGDLAYLSSLGKTGAVELIGANLTAFDQLLAERSFRRLRGNAAARRPPRPVAPPPHADRGRRTTAPRRCDRISTCPFSTATSRQTLLERAVRCPRACEIRLPTAEIRRWKEQFRDS